MKGKRRLISRCCSLLNQGFPSTPLRPRRTTLGITYYLECNGIFSFADHYLPRGTPPSYKYISPGMQDKEHLNGQSRAAVYTSEFDPLRDVDVEYAHRSREAGNEITWRNYDGMTHGWLQMTAWSDEAKDAVRDVAMDLKKFTYGWSQLLASQ